MLCRTSNSIYSNRNTYVVTRQVKQKNCHTFTGYKNNVKEYFGAAHM